MSIRRLLEDVFERVNYLDENVENPFLNKDNLKNPFAQFYQGTYVWIDSNENES